MKLRILVTAVALVATANIAHAINFDYSKYGFNIPADQVRGLKVGDTFTITNVDPFTKGSTETLKDASGKVWAQKQSSVFPGGLKGPGKGVETYKVVAIPSAVSTGQPIKMQAQVPQAAKASLAGFQPSASHPQASATPALAQPTPRAEQPAPKAPIRTAEQLKALSILGLNTNVTDENIREAYKSLSRKWHPDKNLGNPVAPAKYQEINDAYNTLFPRQATQLVD